MKMQREGWHASLADTPIDRLVFIDETWATTNLTRLRGRAPRGQRLIDKVPHGHWQTTTLLAAMDVRGVRCSNIWDGAIDRLSFEAFIEQTLVPTLRPGEVVVMDNLSSHKGHRVRAMIEAAGCRLIYLPPYSPDLNPIELAFSKIKQRLRSLASRTQEKLWSMMQSVLDTVTAVDAAHYFAHRGYTIKAE